MKQQSEHLGEYFRKVQFQNVDFLVILMLTAFSIILLVTNLFISH